MVTLTRAKSEYDDVELKKDWKETEVKIAGVLHRDHGDPDSDSDDVHDDVPDETIAKNSPLEWSNHWQKNAQSQLPPNHRWLTPCQQDWRGTADEL